MGSARGRRTSAWLGGPAHCSVACEVLQHPVFLPLLLICAGQGALEEAEAECHCRQQSPYVLLSLPMFPLDP